MGTGTQITPHPLVDQLRFTRHEWLRGLEGVSEEYGAPMSTPPLREVLDIWHAVTQAADPYLASLTAATLQEELLREGRRAGQSIGSALRRMTYHYWYHIGEIQAIRQMLGQGSLPEYVGDIEIEAPYRPEG
jgi:DinB superfamily